MKRFREPRLSPEAEAYLEDLRTLSDDEFRLKRAWDDSTYRIADARRRGVVLSDRFQRKGTTKP